MNGDSKHRIRRTTLLHDRPGEVLRPVPLKGLQLYFVAPQAEHPRATLATPYNFAKVCSVFR